MSQHTGDLAQSGQPVDDAHLVPKETLEEAMARLAVLCGECEVRVVNPGSIAQFFACELSEPRWLRAAGKRPLHLGFGSGDSALEAVMAAERTMDSLDNRPTKGEFNPFAFEDACDADD